MHMKFSNHLKQIYNEIIEKKDFGKNSTNILQKQKKTEQWSELLRIQLKKGWKIVMNKFSNILRSIICNEWIEKNLEELPNDLSVRGSIYADAELKKKYEGSEWKFTWSFYRNIFFIRI